MRPDAYLYEYLVQLEIAAVAVAATATAIATSPLRCQLLMHVRTQFVVLAASHWALELWPYVAVERFA